MTTIYYYSILTKLENPSGNSELRQLSQDNSPLVLPDGEIPTGFYGLGSRHSAWLGEFPEYSYLAYSGLWWEQ
jgi:hypothetical protein